MQDTYDHADLTGTDFRDIDLSWKDLSHSNLTGCRFGTVRGVNFNCATGNDIDFQGADISGARFEKVAKTVLDNLIGAVWNGVTITGVSGWIVSEEDEYWCCATNAFVQCGCMTKTLADWKAICKDEESIKALHLEQPKIDLAQALAWWRKHSPAIIAAAESLTS